MWPIVVQSWAYIDVEYFQGKINYDGMKMQTVQLTWPQKVSKMNQKGLGDKRCM